MEGKENLAISENPAAKDQFRVIVLPTQTVKQGLNGELMLVLRKLFSPPILRIFHFHLAFVQSQLDNHFNLNSRYFRMMRSISRLEAVPGK